MALTLEELKFKLGEQHDPEALLELLDISAEDLVEAFEDRIIGKFTHLELEVE